MILRKKTTSYAIYFAIIRVFSPLLILIAPSFLSWFVDLGRKNRRLPLKSERIQKKENVLDEFIFFNVGLPRFDQVNIVIRGDINDVVNKNIPTFFVNPYETIPDGFDEVYQITSDRLIFDGMMGNPSNEFYERFNKSVDIQSIYVLPLGSWLKDTDLNEFSSDNVFSVIEKQVKTKKLENNHSRNHLVVVCAHKFKGLNIQIGSGILSVIAALQLSEKVTVYGWDSFLEEEIPKGFLSQSLKLWSSFDDFHPGSRFSANVLNWIYAYRLINSFDKSKLIVHGKVSGLADLTWIEKYLFKVIYK